MPRLVVVNRRWCRILRRILLNLGGSIVQLREPERYHIDLAIQPREERRDVFPRHLGTYESETAEPEGGS